MLDSHVERRIRRAWDFFVANAGELLLGAVVVVVGSLLILPGPWFGLNFLQEVLESLRTGRPVRWQGSYQRKGNFVRGWALALGMGIPILIGFSLLVLPGVLLSLYWLHAPVLVAGGKPVFASLGESGRIFNQRHDWASYFINWLLLLLLWAPTGAFGLAVLLSLPISFAYLVLCFLDETETSSVAPTSHQVTASALIGDR